MENNDMNVLDELNKGSTMGLDAIEFIRKKVGEPNFKNVLDNEYNQYKDISRRINNLYDEYTTEKQPHETSAMNKVMTWWGIQMKAMNDKSNSNLAELLINGTNMGIIEGRRLLNQNPNINKDIQAVLDEYVKMQERSVETLKTFL